MSNKSNFHHEVLSSLDEALRYAEIYKYEKTQPPVKKWLGDGTSIVEPGNEITITITAKIKNNGTVQN